MDQLSLAESATASELAHGKTGKTSQRSPKGHRGPITLDRAIGGKNNGYSRANSSRLHFRFRISLRIRRSRDCIDGSTVPRSTIAVAHARWIPAKPIRYVYPALIDSTDAQHGMHLWRVSYEARARTHKLVLINSSGPLMNSPLGPISSLQPAPYRPPGWPLGII